MVEILTNALAAIFIAAVTSWITVQLSLRRFRSERGGGSVRQTPTSGSLRRCITPRSSPSSTWKPNTRGKSYRMVSARY